MNKNAIKKFAIDARNKAKSKKKMLNLIKELK